MTNTVPFENTENVPPQRKPPWLRAKLPKGRKYNNLKELMRDKELHTVCEAAMCPNIGECWSRGTATFLLMGDICTRSCSFCHIKTGRPNALDEDEPRRVAEAALAMQLKHCVLTSVNRDELPDGGAHIFANTVIEIRQRLPRCSTEVLIPDFRGDYNALKTVMDAKPSILNHNTETVPRLYRTARPQANYQRSLRLLSQAKEIDPKAVSKTGIMVGVGETTSFRNTTTSGWRWASSGSNPPHWFAVAITLMGRRTRCQLRRGKTSHLRFWIYD